MHHQLEMIFWLLFLATAAAFAIGAAFVNAKTKKDKEATDKRIKDTEKNSTRELEEARKLRQQAADDLQKMENMRLKDELQRLKMENENLKRSQAA